MKKINKRLETLFTVICFFVGLSRFVSAQESSVNTQAWFERESLFLESAVEQIVPDTGFVPFATWVGEMWNNLSGGVETGTIWNSLITFGFEQDLSKASCANGLGIIGATAFYYTQSGDFQSRVGSLSAPSNIFSGDMLRVYEVYYYNSRDTNLGEFALRLGQLASDEDFMGMDYADYFLNSNFGAIPANAGSCLSDGMLAFSQYSLATLGATLAWRNDSLDFMLGVYNGNCGEDISSNNGFDYDLQSVALWYQAGYNYCLGGLGGRAIIGGNYHSGRFEDFSTGTTERNFYSFYLGIQQAFLADSEGRAILGGFVRAAWAPDANIAVCTKYVDCGLAWFAPLPAREDDVLALGYSVMEMGSNASVRRWDNMLELTYRAKLTPAAFLQPSFQTYFNTQNSSAETEIAYVFGVRVEVNF